jgi:hypothetical protein
MSEDMWAEFGMKPDIMSTEELLQILDGTKNPHSHRHKDLAALKGSVKAVGFKNVICLWKDPATGKTEVVYGGGRILTGADENLPRLPVVWALDLDKAKAKLLRIADNRVKDLSTTYDDQILIDDLKELKLDGFDYDFLKLEKYDKLLVDDFAADDPLFADLAPGYAEQVNGPARKVDDALGPVQPLPLGGAPFKLEKPGDLDKPFLKETEIESVKNGDSQKGDIMFPSDPVWGIPMLSLKYQAEKVTKPVVKWGEVGRKSKQVEGGIWHFYVEDQKFETLYYNDPAAPLYANPYALVLPNFSRRELTPYSWLMGQTFKKYWLGRYWQSKGFRVFVDMNVRLDADEIKLIGCPINLLGCPRGWKAYAARGYTASIDYIKEVYAWACKWAESDDILFMVIGGGKEVSEAAAKMQWTWIPERLDCVWHPELDGGLALKVPTSEFKNIKK